MVLLLLSLGVVIDVSVEVVFVAVVEGVVVVVLVSLTILVGEVVGVTVLLLGFFIHTSKYF